MHYPSPSRGLSPFHIILKSILHRHLNLSLLCLLTRCIIEPHNILLTLILALRSICPSARSTLNRTLRRRTEASIKALQWVRVVRRMRATTSCVGGIEPCCAQDGGEVFAEEGTQSGCATGGNANIEFDDAPEEGVDCVDLMLLATSKKKDAWRNLPVRSEPLSRT